MNYILYEGDLKMKKLIAVLAVGILAASAANAQSIRLWLSPTGLDNDANAGVDHITSNFGAPFTDTTNYPTGVPTAAGAGAIGPAANPVVDPGVSGLLYLMADLNAVDVWTGFSIDINVVGGDGSITSSKVYQSSAGIPNGAFHTRWQYSGDVAPADGIADNPLLGKSDGVGGIGMAGSAITTNGIAASQLTSLVVTAGAVGGSLGGGTLVLGAINVAGTSGNIFMSVGQGGISRQGGDPANDQVFFGTGDASISVAAFGQASALADATIVPEPASFLLLGLAGLFLRRR